MGALQDVTPNTNRTVPVVFWESMLVVGTGVWVMPKQYLSH